MHSLPKQDMLGFYLVLPKAHRQIKAIKCLLPVGTR